MGGGGRTIAEPSPDGQNNNSCYWGQFCMRSHEGRGVITKFKDEEHQKVEENYRIPLREVTPLEQGAGWWAD